MGEPLGSGFALVRLLQLLPNPQEPEDHARHGGRDYRPRVGDYGFAVKRHCMNVFYSLYCIACAMVLYFLDEIVGQTTFCARTASKQLGRFMSQIPSIHPTSQECVKLDQLEASYKKWVWDY